MLINLYQSIRRRCYRGLIAACLLILSISAFGESEKSQYVFDTFTLENIKDAGDTLGNITVNFSYTIDPKDHTPALQKALMKNTTIKVISDEYVFFDYYYQGDSKRTKAIQNKFISHYNSNKHNQLKAIDELKISLQIYPTREIQQALQSNNPIPLTYNTLKKKIDNYKKQLDLKKRLYVIKEETYKRKISILYASLKKIEKYCLKQE
jgi:hypothetical protein